MGRILAPHEIHTRRRNLYHGYTQAVWANRDFAFHSLEAESSLCVLDDAPRVLQCPASKIVCRGLVLIGRIIRELYTRKRMT